MRRFGLPLLALVAVGTLSQACGGLLRGNGSEEFATVDRVRIESGKAVACWPFIAAATSSDASTCPNDPKVGVPLTGIVPSRLPVEERAADGTTWTPLLYLRGRWSGAGFVLTQEPNVRAAFPSVGAFGTQVWKASGPVPKSQIAADGRPASEGLAAQSRLMTDDETLRKKGVWEMGNGFGENGFEVEVVAATSDAIQTLRTGYGARTVYSWWAPV
jgi:hypothetical protein